VNNSREQEPKAIPCHVQKIEKDFTHIAFETTNSIFTPPVMKMTQSFSRFGREPTQPQDMGMAVPGDYYQGGVTAFAGGRTNFYPRGNLSTLTFQPMANMKAPQRDYDQHHETGGPNGWKVKVMEQQQEGGPGQGGSSGGNGASAGASSALASSVSRIHHQIMQQRGPIQLANGSSGTGTGASQGVGQEQSKSKNTQTEFSFDKNDVALMRSYDADHWLTIDGPNGSWIGQSTGSAKLQLKGSGKIVHNPGGGAVYLGGDPDKKDKFCLVLTTCGPSANVFAKI
jgi:hypothetical protein